MEIYEIYLPVPKQALDECKRFYMELGLTLATDEAGRAEKTSIGFLACKKGALGKPAIVCLRSNDSPREIMQKVSSVFPGVELISSPDEKLQRIRVLDPAGNTVLITPNLQDDEGRARFRITD